MYTLSWSNGFRRGFKKASRKDTGLQKKIFSVLEKLSREPFDPALKTHKLHGKLIGLWAGPVRSSMIAVLYLPLKKNRITKKI